MLEVIIGAGVALAAVILTKEIGRAAHQRGTLRRDVNELMDLLPL